MRDTFVCFAVMTFALLAVAEAQMTIIKPALVECEPALIQWQGGTAPFLLKIENGVTSDPDPIQVARWTGITGQEMTWVVNCTSDTPITLHVTDSDGNDARTEDKFVQAGSSSSCIDGSGSPSDSAPSSPTSQPTSTFISSTSSQDAATTSPPQEPSLPPSDPVTSTPTTNPQVQNESATSQTTIGASSTAGTTGVSNSPHQSRSLTNSASSMTYVSSSIVRSDSGPQTSRTASVSDSALPTSISGASARSSPKRPPIAAVIGAAIGAVVLLALSILAVVGYRRRRHRSPGPFQAAPVPFEARRSFNGRKKEPDAESHEPLGGFYEALLNSSSNNPSYDTSSIISPHGGLDTLSTSSEGCSTMDIDNQLASHLSTTSEKAPLLEVTPSHQQHDVVSDPAVAPTAHSTAMADQSRDVASTDLPASSIVAREVSILRAQLAELSRAQQATRSPNTATEELMRQVASLRAEMEELRNQDYDAESLPRYSASAEWL